MKTTHITLKLTPDELHDIAFAMEQYVTSMAKSGADLDDVKGELDILQHFINHHSYYLDIYSEPDIWNRQEFQDATEWYEALVEKYKKEKEAGV